MLSDNGKRGAGGMRNFFNHYGKFLYVIGILILINAVSYLVFFRNISDGELNLKRNPDSYEWRYSAWSTNDSATGETERALPSPFSLGSLDELEQFARTFRFGSSTIQEWDIGGCRVYTYRRVYGSSATLEDLAIYAVRSYTEDEEYRGDYLRLFLSLPTEFMHPEIEQAPDGVLKIYNWNKKTGKREIFLSIHQVP